MPKRPTLLFLFFLIATIGTQAQSVELLQQGKHTSIRGLSVVDDSVAWISGSRGNIAITTNGGKTWSWQLIKGFERSDFRDIEAFSDKEAMIMSSGTPALILKTSDGGISWQEKYRNTDTTCFLDAMDFDTQKHGVVLGDPIKNKFLLLETNDSGETWHLFKSLPTAIPGEAAFAASGTCLRLYKNEINIVSGGTATHLLSSKIKNPLWHIVDLPIAHGISSSGAFSIADTRLVTGGNYAKDKIRDSTACYSLNNGKSWQLSNTFPAGFQSSVEHIDQNIFLSTGTSGSNITTDGGKNWNKIDNTSYNVCRKAKSGKLILLAGDGGRIGILKL